MPLVDTSTLLTTSGVCRTTSLFYETTRQGDTPVFVFNPTPPPGAAGLIKFRDIYMAFCVDDPTEGRLAEEVFGDFRYWEKISNTSAIIPYIQELRELATIKRKELAFKAIVEEARTGKNKLAAAKYLIEEPWITKTRKTKAQIEETSRRAASSISQDLDRLREDGYFN